MAKIFLALLLCQAGFAATDIKAPQKLWYPAVLTFDGPSVDESESTYRNYRLDVTFTKGTKSYKVPGYFAADGNASETSASSGNKWRVKFTPDEPGTWNYSVSFRAGTDIAISFDPNAGTPVPNVDGEKGTFTAGAYDPSAPGFFGKGMFRYVGEHYGQFTGNGEWFAKAGPGGPEDFFGYKDFDNTSDYPVRNKGVQPADSNLRKLNGEGLHYYSPHVADWKPGDPSWQGGKGKGIIGALNYLASIGANSIYMIIMTFFDDSDNTWPWVGRTDFLRYDVSKLEQWDIVFAHMDHIGFAPTLLLSESDNNKELDGGDMTLRYPIYYREIIARFGHHLGMRYSIGEEPQMSPEQLRAAAELLSRLDAYSHPVGNNSSHLRTAQFANYSYMLGKDYFDGAWIQLHEKDNVDHTDIYLWRNKSDSAGHKWIVTADESWDISRDNLSRAEIYCWQTIMAGGEGFLQYTGYSDPEINDIALENFRLIENTLKLLINGKNLFMIPGINSLLPRMKSEDGLVENAGMNDPPFCLAKKGDLYIVYRKSFSNQKALDLTGQSGQFYVKWYDPRSGGALQNGSVTTVSGGGKVTLGSAPRDNDKSWAIVVSKSDLTSSFNPKPGNPISGPMIQGFTAHGLRLFLPHQGEYKLDLYDISGKLLGQTSGTGTCGINHVIINYPNANGKIIIARLEFNSNTMVKQLVDIAR